LARYAIGGINFLIKSSKNLERCETVSWWADFISSFIGGIKLRVERIKPTLERKMKWLSKSVSATLAVAKKVYGESYINHLLVEGESNMSSKHHSVVEVALLDRKIFAIS
ncbi:MAG TPA: replication initiation factor domain-containing protein, partial [Phormidium sp.]